MEEEQPPYPDRIRIGQLSPGDTALLRDLAEAAAEKAVHKVFVTMGLDPANPIKAQEDFSVMRYVGDKIRDPAFKDDLAWVRRSRLRGEGIVGKAMATAVGIAVLGGAHAIWSGLKGIVASIPISHP